MTWPPLRASMKCSVADTARAVPIRNRQGCPDKDQRNRGHRLEPTHRQWADLNPVPGGLLLDSGQLGAVNDNDLLDYLVVRHGTKLLGGVWERNLTRRVR